MAEPVVYIVNVLVACPETRAYTRQVTVYWQPETDDDLAELARQTLNEQREWTDQEELPPGSVTILSYHRRDETT